MIYSDVLNLNKNNKVLCVGLLCLDIVSVCDEYPKEGTDQRCLKLHWQKGGNAANCSAVLGLLNENVDYMGTVAESENSTENLLSTFVENEMTTFNVGMKNIVVKKNHQTPCSQVIINLSNGSRTIVHSANFLPEITVDDFLHIDLSKYSLIHFEGRNINEVLKMCKLINTYNKQVQPEGQIVISIEAEKPKRPEVISIMPFADIVIVSREFAEFHKYKNAVEGVKGFKQHCKPGSFIVCPWGDLGAAYGIVGNSNEDVVMVPAKIPKKVVDTLGAGDTFIGALICGLIKQKTLAQSVNYACLVAGHKVSAHGFKHIKEVGLKL